MSQIYVLGKGMCSHFQILSGWEDDQPMYPKGGVVLSLFSAAATTCTSACVSALKPPISPLPAPLPPTIKMGILPFTRAS